MFCCGADLEIISKELSKEWGIGASEMFLARLSDETVETMVMQKLVKFVYYVMQRYFDVVRTRVQL